MTSFNKVILVIVIGFILQTIVYFPNMSGGISTISPEFISGYWGIIGIQSVQAFFCIIICLTEKLKENAITPHN